MTSMQMQSLTCTIDDGLAEVTLNQPDRGNPIDGTFARELRDLAINLGNRADVRAVLLLAKGRFFSVGGDIKSFVTDRAALPGIVKTWTADLHSAISRLQRMNAPVVTAVHGDVAGGSVSLVAFSDIVIAAEQAKFTAAFPMIGFNADSGSTLSLSARMGYARAKRFLMLSETLTARQAEATGLVDIVVDAAATQNEAREIARKLASGPTLAYGAIKRTMLTARILGLEAQMEEEAQSLAANSGTNDAWEGLNAFVARRKPKFTGQ
ncbi:enoyl-CoA hydratase/isomerase family protein [Ferrovibrio sp.]|uniref:enoyl-CoA hydratase/isomerase family protein n=1 Tax=Ferrovibrio sp. TaxID=1917215 RepID=UPI003D0F447C